AGGRVHVESAWLNAVSVEAGDASARIAALPCVRKIEPVRGGRRLTPKGAEEAPMGSRPPPVADDFYGLSHDQLNQINLLALHAQGFDGSGVRIGILDTGFKRTHAAFNAAGHPLQVIAEHDFVRG